MDVLSLVSIPAINSIFVLVNVPKVRFALIKRMPTKKKGCVLDSLCKDPRTVKRTCIGNQTPS